MDSARDKKRIVGENRRMGDTPISRLPFDCSAVLDATMDALIVHDASGRIVHVNQCACAMYGYERHEFASIKPEDLSENTPPYAAADATRHVQNALLNGMDEFLWHCRRKSGELFWSEVSLRRHAEGSITFVIAIVRDITARKRIEDALRESEEKLSKMFHGSSNAIAVTELESGQIVDVNRTWIASSGMSRNDVLGKTMLDLGLWKEPAARESCERELRQTGRVRQREVVLIRANHLQPTLVSAEALALSGGTCVLWEFHDLSALRRSEAATREREARLRMISENFDSGMIYQLVATKDGDRRFTYVSDAVRRLYGASPEAVLEDSSLVFSRHHEEDAVRIREAEAIAFDNMTTFRAQFRVNEPSGEVRWSSVVSTPRPQPDGTVIWEGIEFVITDLKRAEEQRASLERQLEHAQRMESVGRLAGGVAHDFNNMLGVVLGHVELAKADLPNEHPLRANLDGIEKAAQRSKELTLQLLAFARKQAIVPRVVDLSEVITSTLHILQRLIREDIRLVWQPVSDLWRLRMDASQIDQILTNLCVNARDAIDGAGTVTIEVANVTLDASATSVFPDLAPGDHIRLTVTDDGCGMDRETQLHIFEPFFTTKGVGAGTGLGLSTIYGIVRQNGGAISVDSEPGRGTTFVIYLPRYQGPEIPTREIKVSRKPKSGTETLLVVEDETTVLGVLCSLLRRSGYKVLSASEPRVALELARQNAGSIRLLISDVIMPGMNGRELAREVQQIIPGVPLLFMSGYTADIVDWQALGSGAAFLQKPFVAGELMKTVRELIDGASSAAPP